MLGSSHEVCPIQPLNSVYVSHHVCINQQTDKETETEQFTQVLLSIYSFCYGPPHTASTTLACVDDTINTFHVLFTQNTYI